MFSQIPQYQQLRWSRSSVSGLSTIVWASSSFMVSAEKYRNDAENTELWLDSLVCLSICQPIYLSTNTDIYLYWIIVLVNHSRCIYNRTPLKWSPLGATLHVWNMEASVNSGASSIFLVGMAMCTQAVEHDKSRPITCHTMTRKTSIRWVTVVI